MIGTCKDLLGKIEVQSLLEEAHVVGHRIDAGIEVDRAHQHHVVQPVHARALQAVRPGFRIDGPDTLAPEFLLGVQVHHVATWERKADGLAAATEMSGGMP
ncbi:hypothetical protein D3C72_1996920 [compost metagenome]